MQSRYANDLDTYLQPRSSFKLQTPSSNYLWDIFPWVAKKKKSNCILPIAWPKQFELFFISFFFFLIDTFHPVPQQTLLAFPSNISSIKSLPTQLMHPTITSLQNYFNSFLMSLLISTPSIVSTIEKLEKLES